MPEDELGTNRWLFSGGRRLARARSRLIRGLSARGLSRALGHRAMGCGTEADTSGIEQGPEAPEMFGAADFAGLRLDLGGIGNRKRNVICTGQEDRCYLRG